MPRYRLVIEYDGSPFAGWQRQESVPSVQQALEDEIAVLAGQPVRLHCAGRTDAGVHALGQVAHVDLPKPMPPDKLRDAINARLRQGGQPCVTVLEAMLAADDFEARFHAVKRHYLFRILDRRVPPALDRGRIWHVPYRLDHEVMQVAAQHLVGHHDFTTFRAAECQSKSPVKSLDRLDVARVGAEIHVSASALSFLHHQVRSMVGCLKAVGRGVWQPMDVKAALEARDRTRCAAVAPPEGLYLVRVDYPAA